MNINRSIRIKANEFIHFKVSLMLYSFNFGGSIPHDKIVNLPFYFDALDIVNL